ncbi:MAG: DNA topoisomerase I [Candidatus Nanoarchaeia archaeon]|nr:DNA topoisomerase I [Candidatus Nanoarchaeia archaeon]MDD5357954.1 DNA topoisomerase I [Candidatus Nanoarchaeia archaeon]MDD5588873.1 DNA topoisomerase I [Candidatus Nanoarchaeia archaeon]
MRKKPEKSKEQKLAENYFPVDERDIKYAVEKPYKQPLNVELVTSKIKSPRKTTKKKVVKRKGKSVKKYSGKEKSYEPPKVNLKKEGYELIITEKPQAAMKIADALGKSKKENLHGIPYYELKKDGKQIVVACAVGHLFTLTQLQKGSGYPVFDIKWVPNYFVKKADFTKKYYDTLLSLVKNAGSITVATDYDIEGEVIGLNVVRFICNQKDANRMKFSTLTKPELNTAYETKSPTINWGQAIAGETRHYLDWFYGINLSRALMNAIKETGRFKIMSIGRVQGPALNLIVQRERKIQEFKSQKYWQVFITVEDDENKVELKYIKDIFDKKELEQFENLIGKTAIASTIKKEEYLPPNPPFNLTSLQMEAYRLHGLTPTRTLQIAQSLYLAGLISYPRTSSQKLPDSIGYKEILEKLARQFRAEKLITRDKPVEGKKSDPAHPSIYPTGENGTLSEEEGKIYNLIVKRFLSLFCEDAIVDNKTITAEVDKLKFNTKGSEVRKKAWLEIYPYKIKETELPDMNGEVKIVDSRTEEKETQPPKRYSPASIVSELEKRNLGTKATRAAILETLYDRGYVKEKSIEATPLGISLIGTLEKYSPVIIDEELTRKFEKEMDSIVESKKDFEQKENRIIEEAKETIREISGDFEKNKMEIGRELITAESKQWEQEKEANKLNVCPICKKGMLSIMYSRKTRRSFVACNAYPECKKTYSLPPNGVIKKTDKICDSCGFPMLMRLSKGKRPWIFCFNNECESNKKRLEEYNLKKQQEENETPE